MNSHNGDKKIKKDNQVTNTSAFKKIMSGQNDVPIKIFSYLDLRSIWRFSNVNRPSKQKFLSMAKLNESEQKKPYKCVSDYELSCNFVNFVYGKGNTERLSKIADEAVKYDANVYENSTDDQLHVLIPVTGKSGYIFEKSIFSQINGTDWCLDSFFHNADDWISCSLVKEMLWHMVLLDILNIKLADFERKKSLPEEILDIVKRNSQNRLNFLFGDKKNYGDIPCGGFADALYDYATLIFKLPYQRKELSTEKEDLIRKIFACFVKVAFLRMEQAAQFEAYKKDLGRYGVYRDVILNLKRCFYMCNNPYRNPCDHINDDDYYTFKRYIHTDAQDMATYLFLTDELEDLFETDEYFVYDFGFDYYHAAVNYEYSHFGAFLVCLDKIKSLEERYKENEDEFIKMFVDVKNVKWVYWDFIEHFKAILTFFKNTELRGKLIDNVIAKFKRILGTDSKELRWKFLPGRYEQDGIFGTEDSLDNRIKRITFQDEEVKKYCGCLIKHFANSDSYDLGIIKMVSNKIFGNGELTFSDFLSYFNNIEPLEKRYKTNRDKFMVMFFPAEKYRCLELDEKNLLLDDHSRAILAYFKSKTIQAQLIENLNYKIKSNWFSRACKITIACCKRKTKKTNHRIHFFDKCFNSMNSILPDTVESGKTIINPEFLNSYRSIFSDLNTEYKIQNKDVTNVPKMYGNQNKNK